MLERDYIVAEAPERLEISVHSLWKRGKAVKPGESEEQAAELVEAKSEILRLRVKMCWIEEERDTLKRPGDTLSESPSKAPVHDHRNKFDRTTMYCILQLNRSGFYQRLHKTCLTEPLMTFWHRRPKEQALIH